VRDEKREKAKGSEKQAREEKKKHRRGEKRGEKIQEGDDNSRSILSIHHKLPNTI